jgi:uncharacterized membrane protein YdjX (TVP38/TMEM64 family)
MLRSLVRPLLLLSLVLIVPIVPFIVWGDALEAQIAQIFDPPPPPAALFALIAGVLASDIFLPVPSSMVGTLAGSQLGVAMGTLTSWLGMTAGGVAGFALARKWGRPLALRLASETDLDRLDGVAARFGPLLIVLTRGVPVFAEACVLLLGVNRLPWSRLLPALVASNLGLALAYAAFGRLAADQQWLPAALGISLGLPIAFTGAARWWLVRPAPAKPDSECRAGD